MMDYVVYYRVSTVRQGQSGLGLEAQQKAVKDFLGGATPLASFTEIESGRKDDRPQLIAALAAAKAAGATLLIAKLDRLARRVAFIANLLDSGVEVTACDMPEVNRFTLHIMAAMAKHEAKMISDRIRAGLAAKKARGEPMGWAIPGRTDHAKTVAHANVARIERADKFANRVGPRAQSLRDKGLTLVQLAEEFNALNVPTPNGGKWWSATISALLKRYEGLREAA